MAPSRQRRGEQKPSAELAARINNEHRLAHQRLGESLSHAVETGRLLLEARADIEHGQWLSWVRANCEFSPRMAQNYLRLARDRQALPPEEAKRVSHSSLRAALRALSSGSEEEQSGGEGSTVHFSSASDQWNTPQLILERTIALLVSIDLDPCSNEGGAPNVPATQHYTEQDDGLSQEWKGRVFLNPPYGREIHEWTSRLDENYRSGAVTEALALVPARTDARWFTELRQYPRCFIRGRLKFGRSKNSAPFPSAVFYLGPK